MFNLVYIFFFNKINFSNCLAYMFSNYSAILTNLIDILKNLKAFYNIINNGILTLK